MCNEEVLDNVTKEKEEFDAWVHVVGTKDFGTLFRIRVPGGWIYRNNYNFFTFVPDPEK